MKPSEEPPLKFDPEDIDNPVGGGNPQGDSDNPADDEDMLRTDSPRTPDLAAEQIDTIAAMLTDDPDVFHEADCCGSDHGGSHAEFRKKENSRKTKHRNEHPGMERSAQKRHEKRVGRNSTHRGKNRDKKKRKTCSMCGKSTGSLPAGQKIEGDHTGGGVVSKCTACHAKKNRK